MNHYVRYFAGLAIVAIFLPACVPPQQFAELESEASKCKEEREQLYEANETLTVSNTELKAKLEASNKKMEELQRKMETELDDYNSMKTRYRGLNDQYLALQAANSDLMDGSTQETRRLIKKLEASQADLMKREEELNKLSISLSKEQQRLEVLETELQSRNQRLVELERMLAAKDSATNALRQKVAEALTGFSNKGLTVTKKNGKVYVSLDEKLLFSTGSTEVDAQGVSALKQLAKVLEQNPDIDITIEGHTDDVPVMANQRFQDNWDLSVKRATSIIRILLENSKIDPRRLTASGRGEFLPIDPAKTPEARQKNRRTEIILTPNLSEILNLLNED